MDDRRTSTRAVMAVPSAASRRTDGRVHLREAACRPLNVNHDRHVRILHRGLLPSHNLPTRAHPTASNRHGVRWESNR